MKIKNRTMEYLIRKSILQLADLETAISGKDLKKAKWIFDNIKENLYTLEKILNVGGQ